jgi:SAM-dependent methyltransferase
MSDWTAGYVADIGYTYGCYSELNPLRAKLAFLNAGLVCPDFGTACELGFGQGVSVNMHAAASICTWHGTDFNPSQASYAQALARSSGAAAQLSDEAFAEFANRTDLPDFDYMGLHGIWSWISDENRAVIVDFVRRKLKVGGVLYVSYNTQPGWASFAPVRHLMNQHADVMTAMGQGAVALVEGALDFAQRLMATEPLFAKANPLASERLGKIKSQDKHYLAHEFFNRDWHPMLFGTMAQWLEPAKVQFACSAHYLDHVDALNLSAAQQAFLKDIPDAVFRESVRDFMVNQQFRRDYWVKGGRQLSALDQAEALRQQRVVLVSNRADVSLQVTGSLGEARMTDALYNPLLDELADHQPKTLAQLEKMLQKHGVSFFQLQQAIMVLVGANHLAPAQDEAIARAVKSCTDKLNMHLMEQARSSNDVQALASPVTGGGVQLGRFQQLFLLAIRKGQTQPEQWAQSVWHLLALQNQKLVKDGAPLETPEDNLNELEKQAEAFAEKQLPALKALMIA